MESKQVLVHFFFVSLAIFFLPGQNFYQTAALAPQKPLVREIPFNLPPPASYPVKTTNAPPPDLTAGSALVLDLASSVVLYEKKPNTRFAPASTTKIMTALVALETYELDDVLTVKTAEKEGRIMYLQQGERMTAENLLYGLLVHSANDAAVTLAENYPGGREKFISAMNRKAKKLNMNNTHFENENGLEQESHYVSSIDLARLAAYALNNPTFLDIVETKKIAVMDVEQKEVHQLENVNTLLGKIPGLYGVKTGWTENAGECLVAVTERQGNKIMTVVLKSEDRFGETEKLINWAFANHRWVGPPTP
ncbi:MAG: D-alanyl-D-alanine carboxypeptidase family protein [bacterium]|nr:D-alanyl-D-alanine carboxypeptidase family protein [bacterium]